MTKHFPFRLLTAAVCIFLVLPVLIQDGMFMDAVLYTSVSKNLGNGLGTFWEPFFSQTWENSGSTAFHEHPPLAFGIQALFFKLFGNSIYTERIYTFLMMLMAIGFITKLWHLIFPEKNQMRKFSWLPVLLWILIPVCYWSYQSNMMENTVNVFSLAAVYFGLKFYLNSEKTNGLFISGFFIFLASFTKGVPGLFPLALPGIYWLSTRNISFVNMLLHTSLLTLVVFGIYGMFLFHDPARESLAFYFEHRLLNRIDNDPTVTSRFFALNRLSQELLPLIMPSIVLVLYFKIKKIKQNFSTIYLQNVSIFILLGISGSLPIMLTLVQRGFYMVPALPFFAIGFAMIIAPRLEYLFCEINIQSRGFRIFKYSTMLLLLGSIIFTISKIGKIEREQDLLHDVYQIKKIVPAHSIISLSPQLIHDAYLETYLIRNADISCTTKDANLLFYISEKNKNLDNQGFEKLDMQLLKYDIWKKKERTK